MVIIDKDIYIEKFMTLLNDEEVYHECRGKTSFMDSKLVKHLIDNKNFHWSNIHGSIHQTLLSR